MSRVKCLVALGLAGALATASTPTQALPVLTNTAAVKTAVGDEVTQVRWGRGWGWGAGAFIGGLALGAALATPSYAYPSYGYYGYPYASYGYSYPYYGSYYGGYRRLLGRSESLLGVSRILGCTQGLLGRPGSSSLLAGGGWGVRRAAYVGGPRGYWRGRR